MPHHRIVDQSPERPSGWWVVTAWATLGLLVACGLAGAAGLG